MTATDTTPAPEAAPEAAADPLESLQHAVVERLMGIIGAPDDPQAAQAGDEAVRDLDAALRAQAGSA